MSILDRIRGKDPDAVDESIIKGTFDEYPHLKGMKPKEGYVFHSDYYTVDDQVATVRSYFHDDESRDGYGDFWGVNRIPAGLDDDVTTIGLEQVSRRGEGWIEERLKKADQIEKINEREQAESGNARSQRKRSKVANDVNTASAEIADGAAYLHVHYRMFVRAKDLETLDHTMEKIESMNTENFGTLRMAAYPGEQRRELANAFANNDKKRGKGFDLTSTELSGSYNIVTNGMDDPDGEYIGQMVGDVNSSAVVMNVNGYDSHVVVATSKVHRALGNQNVADMWGSKLGQSALVDNNRVVHIVLNGADLDRLGPKFDALTYRVDMRNGEVNMFEIFGDKEDELTLFSAHISKLALMAEQIFTSEAGERMIARGMLEDLLKNFYIHRRMWVEDAKNHRDDLRVVGIPHDEVPLLHEFIGYLETRHKAVRRTEPVDQNELKAIDVLKAVFTNLLSQNGDLFDQPTSPAIDGARDGRRVVYDFSGIRRRGNGVAMAQLVNVISFAAANLESGGTVIIHGADEIVDPHNEYDKVERSPLSNAVKKYMYDEFESLRRRGGRVVYIYTNVDRMIADKDFNEFDAADYTVLGNMRSGTLVKYQKEMLQAIPRDLKALLLMRDVNYGYIRRGIENVVFAQDLLLGINPEFESVRRKIVTDEERPAAQTKVAQVAAEAPITTSRSTKTRRAVRQKSVKKAATRSSSRKETNNV